MRDIMTFEECIGKMLSEKQIKEFQDLYKRHFGKELSREQATEKAMNLLNLYKAIFKKESPGVNKKVESPIVNGEILQVRKMAL